MTRRSFGELELAVLRILKNGSHMTVNDMIQALGNKDKYTTIMTVMARLAEKKILTRKKIGASYVYWLVKSPKGKISSMIDQFKKQLLGIKTTELISHLIESAEDISETDIDELENLIENAKLKRHTK